MTFDEQLQYYSDLLILQYKGKPKAQATIQALASQLLCSNISIAIRDAFNIDPSLGPVAIGVQLDIIGKYAGVTRDYFTSTGSGQLDDSEFLTLIQMAIAKNNCDGTLLGIDTLLFTFFGNSIIVFDNANMTLSYFINSNLATETLLRDFIRLDLLPRPMGVNLAAIVYAVGLDNYFAFSSYYLPWPTGVSGFDSYYSGISTTGDTTLGSPIVINIPDTTGMAIGDAVGGTGVDFSSNILTVDSPTQITLTKNARSTEVGGTIFVHPSMPWINYSNTVNL